MTKQEAIELLGEQKYFLTKNVYKSTNETDREWKLTKALDMAIEALTQEPSRATGKWIRNDNGTYSCNLCQSWIPEEQYHYARFCLHCGVRLESDEE